MPLDQPDKDWYKIVDLDQRILYGYADMVMFDDEMLMIPLPDRKHWLEPIAISHEKKEIEVNMWAYSENEKFIERVTVCKECGTLVDAAASQKHKLCPDCHDFRKIARDT